MREIAEGAEAKIFFDEGKSRIVKHRVRKIYRIEEIDKRLRRQRTRREAKVFEVLHGRVMVPALRHYSDESMKIEMGFVKGKKLRDVLDRENAGKLCGEVGEGIGVMHSADVIHGDLTTSNMILCDDDKNIYFIDFGLSFFSNKIEDKAVDLHLLRQALESKHHTIWRECFEAAVRGYRKTCPAADDVLKRFERVELRGRYKGKGS